MILQENMNIEWENYMVSAQESNAGSDVPAKSYIYIRAKKPEHVSSFMCFMRYMLDLKTEYSKVFYKLYFACLTLAATAELNLLAVSIATLTPFSREIADFLVFAPKFASTDEARTLYPFSG
jgi:hypothetical protein